MPQPIVYVDRSLILDGKREELERSIGDLVRHVAANEPRLLAYDVYLSEGRSSMTVIHVHPDSASLEHHMRVVAPLLPPFGDLIKLLAIDVYGSPGPAILDHLRRKAAVLGGAVVTVHAHRSGLRGERAGRTMHRVDAPASRGGSSGSEAAPPGPETPTKASSSLG